MRHRIGAEVVLAVTTLAALALLADAVRRVYAVGQEANDHFVAVVVAGCMGLYWLLSQGAPGWALPAMLAGMVGIWGLFFAIHGDRPPNLVVRMLAVGSQLAYAFALWAGLLWLVRAPLALLLGWPLIWPGAALLLPLGLALGGWINQYRWAQTVRHHAVPGLPATVVQLSDLHASLLMHRRELDPLVDRVNALSPDLVVVTGDLVMPFSEKDHSYLIAALSRLQPPTLCCPGNHDLPVLERLREALGPVAPLLIDEARTLHLGGRPVQITGVNFHWTAAQARLDEALDTLPKAPEAYRILLAHDPRLGPWLPHGRFDLVLSGHTHGGQVAANWLGLPVSMLRLFGVRDQGWWDVPGGRQYVHRGNWLTGLPPRMGVAGEIAVFSPAPPDGRGGPRSGGGS